MTLYDEELDLSSNKIKNMEVTISEMQDIISSLNHELKETQKFLIKLAHNQAEITKRVSMWPYVAVPKEE